MKTMIFNGSPRKGNTWTAVNILAKEGDEVVDTNSLKVKPCAACDKCKSNGGTCVFNDDSVEIMEKLLYADKVIFATPVYWWGMSAQLKLVVDKIYQKSEIFKTKPSKKVGVVSVGAADLDDPEYRLIREQMECICGHLGWELAFSESICAGEIGDFTETSEAGKKLKEIAEKF